MSLRISALNINGLISKRTNNIKTHEFQDILDNSDVVLPKETWTSDLSDIRIYHFESFQLRRKEKKKNAKQNSGGLIVYIRNHHVTPDTLVCKSHDDIICVKISKTYYFVLMIFTFTYAMLPQMKAAVNQ